MAASTSAKVGIRSPVPCPPARLPSKASTKVFVEIYAGCPSPDGTVPAAVAGAAAPGAAPGAVPSLAMGAAGDESIFSERTNDRLPAVVRVLLVAAIKP